MYCINSKQSEFSIADMMCCSMRLPGHQSLTILCQAGAVGVLTCLSMIRLKARMVQISPQSKQTLTDA